MVDECTCTSFWQKYLYAVEVMVHECTCTSYWHFSTASPESLMWESRNVLEIFNVGVQQFTDFLKSNSVVRYIDEKT